MLTVGYPNQCSVGGDAIALVAGPGHEPTAVNGSGAAPADVDVAGVRRRHGDVMPWYGVDTITVPGVVSTWWRLHADHATWPWADLLRPAIGLARDGVPVSPGLNRALHSEMSRITADPGLREVFLPDGRALAVGELLLQPRLADTLTRIADDGPLTLYGGALGGELIQGLAGLGCALTVSDLARHQCEATPSVSRSWRDYDVHVAPPNSQGICLLQQLACLEAAPMADPLGRDADGLSAVFSATAQWRDHHLADPRIAPIDVTAALDASTVESLVAASQERMTTTAGSHAADHPSSSGRSQGDTVAVVTTDAEGRFVSLIQSVYQAFGSGILEPSTGIVLHDRGAGFCLDPDSPNFLQPLARPAHTLMPVLLARDGVVVAALGSQGGKAQPQILTQLMLRLGGGASAQEAVSAPRWIMARGENGVDAAWIEADLADPARASLGTYPTRELPARHDDAGHAMVVRRSTHDVEEGTDPRADGL